MSAETASATDSCAPPPVIYNGTAADSVGGSAERRSLPIGGRSDGPCLFMIPGLCPRLRICSHTRARVRPGKLGSGGSGEGWTAMGCLRQQGRSNCDEPHNVGGGPVRDALEVNQERMTVNDGGPSDRSETEDGGPASPATFGS